MSNRASTTRRVVCSMALFLFSGHTPVAFSQQPAPPVVKLTKTSNIPPPRGGLPNVDPAATLIINSFFTALELDQIDQAYDDLTKGTTIAEKSEDVSNLKAKTREAITAFGEIRGHELVAYKPVGTHLFSATYLSLGKNLPLRWRFYFYKTDDVWKLIDIGVDDRLVDIFEEVVPVTSPSIGAQ